MRINYYLVEPVSGCVIMCFFPVAFTANGASVLNSKRFTEWLLWILCEMSSFIVHQQWRMIFDERTFFFRSFICFRRCTSLYKKGTHTIYISSNVIQSKKKMKWTRNLIEFYLFVQFFSCIISNSLSLMAQCFWQNIYSMKFYVKSYTCSFFCVVFSQTWKFNVWQLGHKSKPSK